MSLHATLGKASLNFHYNQPAEGNGTEGPGEKRLEDVEARLAILEENSDRFFLVTMAMLIFLMHVGFGFLEAGSTRGDIIII